MGTMHECAQPTTGDANFDSEWLATTSVLIFSIILLFEGIIYGRVCCWRIYSSDIKIQGPVANTDARFLAFVCLSASCSYWESWQVGSSACEIHYHCAICSRLLEYQALQRLTNFRSYSTNH